MNNKIQEWNKHAKDLNLHKKIVDTRLNYAKTFATIILLLIALGFLSIYSLRTYYYDNFRDLIEVINTCEPITNISLEVEKQCGDVNLECNFNSSSLIDICPKTINIIVNSSL